MSAKHGNPIPLYMGIFTFLLVATGVEALPLFEIVNIPAPILLALSAVKFALVAMFFMHLWGDHSIFTKLFFIPLGMAGVTVAVLISLYGTWTLTWQQKGEKRDDDLVASAYPSRHEGKCNSWLNSQLTHNAFCSSPYLEWNKDVGYEVIQKEMKASDPRFDGFDAKSDDDKKAVLMAVGKEVYEGNCQSCHQASGAGLPGIFPPLANDPVATGPVEKHIEIILKGMNGVEINGVKYSGAMPAWPQLSDQQIAAVVTYERNTWGNSAGVAVPSQVASAR